MPWPARRQICKDYLIAATAGAVLGLSAPGFELWYLAWVGLVPLLLLIAASSSPWQALLRGTCFGTAYNLVYLNWYLCLYPLNWLGFNQWQGALLAAAAWLTVCLHQGVIIGLFAAIVKMLPLTGGFLPRRKGKNWYLPALVVVPLVWVLVENILGNAHDALGVPWSMLEYGQYKQIPFLQAASIIGGIGLSCLIVAVNVSLAGLLATVSRRLPWQSLSCPGASAAVSHVLTLALVICLIYAWGLSSLASRQLPATCSLSIVQGNINIDMQKCKHRYTTNELLARYFALMNGCPPGFCILTESAMPVYLRSAPRLVQALCRLASGKKLDLVFGALDFDAGDHSFNSACAINSNGQLLSPCYHKRYLVPFGEYTPYLVQYMPQWLQHLTNTPAGGGFSSGTKPIVLTFKQGAVAPLICFETLSPELVAASVREGGQLLVNISDLAWFHDSMIGRQMLAFAVLRAVENHRYFVFAANSGPSAVIDPSGRIAVESRPGAKALLVGTVGFSPELTPFTRWFRICR